MNGSQRRAGFTLVEILTVVVILGILAGILFRIGPIVNQRTARAVGASRLEHLKLCIEGYYRVYGEYPRATEVKWEKPGASAGAPDDWEDIILPGASAGNPEWENPGKEYWASLYPYIYEDAAAAEWSEYSSEAGGGGAGSVVHEGDSADLGFEYGGFTYTNAVYTIYDGMGGGFSYSSGPPYQTYVLTASEDMGTGWTE